MMRVKRASDAGGKRRNQKTLALVVNDRDSTGASGIFVLGNCLQRPPKTRMSYPIKSKIDQTSNSQNQEIKVALSCELETKNPRNGTFSRP